MNDTTKPALPEPDKLDPNEQDAVTLWAEIWRLRTALQGPDGYATWQDAAIAERVRRVKAEAAVAETRAVPEDFLTHRDSWRRALILAAAGDSDGYWQHELRAFDAAYVALSIAPSPTMPARMALSDEQKYATKEFIDDYGEYINEIPPLEPDIKDNNGYLNYFSYENVKSILEEYSKIITTICKLKYDTKRNL